MKHKGFKYFRLVDQDGEILHQGGVTVGIWENEKDGKHLYVFAVCSMKDKFGRGNGQFWVSTHLAAACGVKEDEWVSHKELPVAKAVPFKNKAGHTRRSWRNLRKMVWTPKELTASELTDYVHNSFRLANPGNRKVLDNYALLIPRKRKSLVPNCWKHLLKAGENDEAEALAQTAD